MHLAPKRVINEPEMMEYLGGPDTKEQVLSRHKRYLELGDKGCMFSIILYPDLKEVGCIGYWEKVWNCEGIYEIGWSVLPSYQGKGIATGAAKLAIDAATAENKYEYIHAFPSINNLASNAICQKLGFDFISEHEFEYPLGSYMRCNNWRLKLNINK
ncbi:MAG TPA: GNAT family N-acetyltransferase [Clostridia bacterium]|nr:GNAT family N-acetyltransferase [Clostridia bacterium]